MPRVYIGVGSNIEPEINIPKALQMLAEAMRVVAVSTFYRTLPVGSPDSPEFVNGVFAVETEIKPRELKFDVLRGIELALGRVRGLDKCEPRTIDLDIVVYGDLVIHEDDLVIPDPDIVRRAFLAVPLIELEPEFMLPGSNTKLAEIANSMDIGTMVVLDDFTNRLRLEICLEP